ncbi:MAG: hypothetical protein FJZ00_00200 [Candidatus Sericytochromatia bacterium]|uniref:Portal protein n=1 Tax=Candidatus Tanganyikabacteria bacterium TaxID=2961651 RepID=A0A937X4N9_9BACT|nr:hypothetical protein [Candidatus Tanganyikabacteria bacterium]
MAGSDDAGTSGELETREDAGQQPQDTVKLWLQAIELASSEERDWRKSAAETYEVFRMDNAGRVSDALGGNAGVSFNILFSNVETILPAVYNSTPEPDIRRRFGDADEIGRSVAQALERVLSAQIDQYDFSREMKLAIKDMLLPGRGVVRVRYDPQLSDDGMQVVSEAIRCEHVQWDDWLHGAAKTWGDVPWVGFRHRLTREQLRALAPEVAERVALDTIVPGAKEMSERDGGKQPSELFKRAEVWEIWDKERKQVVFVSQGFKEAPLLQVDDPLQLEEFWPCPRPLYAIETSNTLVPVEEYRAYRDQAKELERVTRRINALVKVLKWRGVYDATLGSAFSRMSELEDGELAPSDNALVASQIQGGLEAAIFLMPIDKAAAVLTQLYAQREQIKQTIYEITGIADILRGATVASETATAQQIKAQWGSLRVQSRQAEVARFARDLLRIMAEIVATKFSPEAITAMSAVPLGPEHMQVLQNDFLRSYRVDIETDSTIRADLTRSQEQMSQFVTGLGAFITAVGPAVQAGAMPMDVVSDLLTGFARQFKLGKQAEDALDRLSAQAQAQAQAPQQPPGPSPEELAMQQEQAAAAQAEEQKAAVEAQKAAAQEETRRQEAGAKQQLEQDKLKLEQDKVVVMDALERYKFDAKLQADRRARVSDRKAKMATERERMAASAKPSTMVNLDAKGELATFVQSMQEMREQDRQEMQQVIGLLAQSVAAMAQAADRMGGPKRVVKDAKGEVIGVEPVRMN